MNIYIYIYITKSNRKDKKYMAIIDNKKTIHFGATSYEDFTTHKDEKRKQNYMTRHKKSQKMIQELMTMKQTKF